MKKHIYKIALAAILAVLAVLWALSAIPVDGFGWFNGYLAVAIGCALAGVTLVVTGFVSGGNRLGKKWSIILGTILIVLAIVAVAINYGMDDAPFFVPIIVAVAAVGLFIAVVAVGGKKWDSGDNEKAGYKNYYERKAEADKQKAKEEKKNND